MDKTTPPIIIETVFNVSVETVWSAITNLSEMTQWFFDNIPGFEPIVGFKTSFLVSSEERNFRHLWEVTEVIPKRKITYTWVYEEYDGKSESIFEVSEYNGLSKLTITCIVLEDFPKGIPEFTSESCKGGWNYFMNRLKIYINRV